MDRVTAAYYLLNEVCRQPFALVQESDHLIACQVPKSIELW